MELNSTPQPDRSAAPSPAKEGIVLDAEGQTIYAPGEAAGRANGSPFGTGGARPGLRAHVRVYRGGWWLPIALGVGIPLLFVAGIFIFTLLMTVGLVVVLLRSLFGFGRPLGSR
jgi:hypothetical protein